MEELLAALRALALQQSMTEQLRQQNEQLQAQITALTDEKKPRAKRT